MTHFESVDKHSDARIRGAGLTLHTERLVLAPVGDSDVAALHRHWNDPEVRRHLWDDEAVTIQTVQEVVATSARDFREHGYGLWALRFTSDRPLIGFCGLRAVETTGFVEVLLRDHSPRAGCGE